MLNFLAAEDQQVLLLQSALLQGRSSINRSPSAHSRRRRRPNTHQSHASSYSNSDSATTTTALSTNTNTQMTPQVPEGFFPDLGLSWRDPRRKHGRNWLRRDQLKREQQHHQKILKVMANCVYEPKKKDNTDIWTDPTINERAIEWYTKRQEALAHGRLPVAKKKEVNWFVKMQEKDKVPTPRRTYVPPPPKPPPGPHHPRMLIPVPAVAAEPVAHVVSSKAVMHAVACREHYYKLFERTMLMSRAKGVQYLGGPNKLFKKYFELFGYILRENVKVCRAIEEWRYQLSLITDGNIPYHKSAQSSIRPAFMWGGETLSSKGHKRRYYKNYILKMIEDVQVLIKAEIPAKLGKGQDVLIKKANIAGDYVKAIEVCPLFIPFTLEELLDRSIETNPTNMSGLPSEQWYGVPIEDIMFVAKTMQEERTHVDVQGKLFMNPEAVPGYNEMVLNDRVKLQEQFKASNKKMVTQVAKTSSYGPSLRASVDSVNSVQLRVGKELRKRENRNMSVTFQ
jgi:hypothetical protein